MAEMGHWARHWCMGALFGNEIFACVGEYCEYIKSSNLIKFNLISVITVYIVLTHTSGLFICQVVNGPKCCQRDGYTVEPR